jgi:hypothetical protein
MWSPNYQPYVFAGGFTGSYVSDPATSIFSDLTLRFGDYLYGELGDHFIIQNNLTSHSANLAQWNTQQVALTFRQGTDQFHDLYLTGADLGAIKAGFLNNFAWGKLTLEAGQFLTLLDGNDTQGAALYVGEILGLAIDWQGKLITNIKGNGLNIYYDPLDPANAYLKGQTFAFLNGGYLAPAVIPVPGTVWLLLTGLAGILGLRAKRRQG